MFSRTMGAWFVAWWLGAVAMGCRHDPGADTGQASADASAATHTATQKDQAPSPPNPPRPPSPPSPSSLSVVLDTNGLSINKTRVATPPTLDQLIEILGQPERKPSGDLVYDRYGLIFTESSGVMQIFWEPLKDPQGIYPTAPFVGMCDLGDYRVQATSQLEEVQAKAAAFQFQDPNPGLVPDHPGLLGKAGPVRVSLSWHRGKLGSLALYLKPRP